MLELFDDYIAKIPVQENRARFSEVLQWVAATYPQLVPRVAWNQPMFTDHGTYIIGFSIAKPHFAVAPEQATMLRFKDEIEEAGYDHTERIIRIKWDQPVNYDLLSRLIEFNIADKAETTTFWRP